MKSYFILIQLEVKRALKRLGYLYLGMAALLILAGTAAFLTGRLAYGDRVSERISIGVVLPEMTDWLEKPCLWPRLWKV